MDAKEFFAQKWIDLERKAKEGEANKRRREQQKQYEQWCMAQPIDPMKQLILQFKKLNMNDEIDELIIQFKKLKIETIQWT